MAFQIENVHPGMTVDHTPGADVAAGDVVVQGDLVGVAVTAIPANTLGALLVDGVVRATKNTGGGTAITAGQQLYWDDTNKYATPDDATGTNKRIGTATEAADDDAADVLVFMVQA